MPARSVTVGIREQAERDIAAATNALAEQFGLAAPEPRGYEGKDPEYNRARDLERIAAFLTSLVETVTPSPPVPAQPEIIAELGPATPPDPLPVPLAPEPQSAPVPVQAEKSAAKSTKTKP